MLKVRGEVKSEVTGGPIFQTIHFCPLDTVCKLHVGQMFRRNPGCILNVSYRELFLNAFSTFRFRSCIQLKATKDLLFLLKLRKKNNCIFFIICAIMRLKGKKEGDETLTHLRPLRNQDSWRTFCFRPFSYHTFSIHKKTFVFKSLIN